MGSLNLWTEVEMKKTLQIKNEIVRTNAINLINIIPLDELHEVTIRPYSETKLQKQRSLYFRWLGIMVEDGEWGYEKDELHLELKKEFLVPILYDENEKYRSWIDQWKDESDPDKKKILLEIIMAATSVKDDGLVTKEILSKYMKRVERYSNETGCFLPRPGEDYGDKFKLHGGNHD